ncbi:MAG: alpha/beta hydrolase [Dehalococcoidia bacterium]|jgi:3-oxoadipate enol-lactonase|nr:alpha/beta hydrolase [Dehalococcoidia bacterium]
MPRTMVNGVELFHDEVGSGEPVLLHHGYTSSHDVFLNEIAPRLADRYRCIVMDARGAGESEHPADGYTIEQYALDVIGMADALGLDRFTFVGHSMGGGIGMQLGLEHADRLNKLVLVAPIPSGGTVPAVGQEEATQAMRERQRRLRAAPDGRAELLRERKLMRVRDTSDAQVEASLDRALSVSEGHYEDSMETMRTFNVTDRLGELTTPTLIMAGAADGLAAANVNDWQRLPNATLHVFSRVGHGVPSDVPEEFAAVLGDFLEHGVVNVQTVQQRVAEGMATAAASS